MDGLLGFLCLLCVFITPGHSLSCVTCVGLNSCTGSSETCKSNYSCGVAYRETTEGGNTQTAYIRSCVPTSKCNKVGSITYTGGTMKMGISCCDTDNCTSPLPQWPATSTQANGLVCPSCRSSTLSQCNQETNIQCTGSEQTCLFESTIASGSFDSAMGCATSTLCDVADYSYMTMNYYAMMQFLCFPATISNATGTSCVVCSSGNSLTCNASLSVIPANSKCASAYLITTHNGMKSYQVIRSWAPVSKCNTTGSMTVIVTKYSMGVSCCDGDGCTPSIQDTTSTSAASNGVQCKLCVVPGSSFCETNMMTCTGQETQCVNYAQTNLYGGISSTSLYRGCGTKSLCGIQNLSSTMNYMTVANQFTCESTTINPSTTTPSNGGDIDPISSNGGTAITILSNGGVVFLFLSTAATMLILQTFWDACL